MVVMCKIFLSYSRKDYDIVKRIKQEIEQATKAKCWMDLDGISYESPDFTKIIARAIERASIFVFILNPNSQESRYARNELLFAKARNKHIFFVEPCECEMTLEFILEYGHYNRNLYYVDYQKQKLYEEISHLINTNVEQKLLHTNESKPDKKESDRGFKPLTGEFKRTQEKYIDFKIKGFSFRMISVAGGSFMMGTRPDQDNSNAFLFEKPAHEVVLSDFFFSEAVVTQELWLTVTGNNPSNFKGGNYSVENVSWYDCQNFIMKLNELLQSQLPIGKKFRLPTEAEWEFACKGGNKSKHYKYSGSNNIEDVAWFCENSGGRTHAVKQKKPNELEIYDLSGNVWEWCQDMLCWYASQQISPTPMGNYRVNRGGGWFNNAWNCRAANRTNHTPGYRWAYSPDIKRNYLGFRLAI